MTNIAWNNGGPIMNGNAIGEAPGCCCGSACSGPCPCTSPCCCGRIGNGSTSACMTRVSCCTPSQTSSVWSSGPFGGDIPNPGVFRLRITGFAAGGFQQYSGSAEFDSCACKWYLTITWCGTPPGESFGTAQWSALVDPDPADCLPPSGVQSLTRTCYGSGCSQNPTYTIVKP